MVRINDQCKPIWEQFEQYLMDSNIHISNKRTDNDTTMFLIEYNYKEINISNVMINIIFHHNDNIPLVFANNFIKIGTVRRVNELNKHISDINKYNAKNKYPFRYDIEMIRQELLVFYDYETQNYDTDNVREIYGCALVVLEAIRLYQADLITFL